ncbi:MAG: DUF4331 family protein [Candidatus Eremiobacteraeota bacterium]|nr:DUF4331 family protein [Candidatus Eremiobacteraeota bacterium]
MKIQKEYLLGAALASMAFGFAACGNNNSPGTLFPGVKTGVYQQVELFARPAVKEGTEVFNAHDATNRTEPYNDPTLSANVSSFMTNVAGRDATTTAVATAILSTDEMVVDLSQVAATTGAYLGVETKGALGRSKFGGRALNDDAVDLDLGVLFGNTLNRARPDLVPVDDKKESPCLTTDNIGAQNPNNGPFPFVDPPV